MAMFALMVANGVLPRLLRGSYKAESGVKDLSARDRYNGKSKSEEYAFLV